MANKKMFKKGLINAVAIIILLVIVIALAVPFIFYSESLQSNKEVSNVLVNNYIYLKNLQINQVTSGHPAIVYNGTYVLMVYTNGEFVPPSNLTITEMLYFNQDKWTEIPENYPIVISVDKSLSLPSYVKGDPIILVSSLGNIFYLTPGSEIGPYSQSGVGGIEIITQISNSSGTLPVSTNVTTNIYGTFKNYTTPVEFPNITGSFDAKVPEYVYYENSKGQIVTGVFHNWNVIGKAKLNSTNELGVNVQLEGQPTIVIANYTPVLSKVELTINTNYPGSICLSIDGKKQSVSNMQQTIYVPAGFVNITIYTLQGNNTNYESEGIIEHYQFSYVEYNEAQYITTSEIIFVPPNSDNNYIYVYYQNNYNYYQICLIAYNDTCNDNIFIGGVGYNYNNSYWIIGGNYYFNPIVTFTGSYTQGAITVCFEYSNGTTFTYNFPKIPDYIIINQPMNIIVYYNVTIYWTPLSGE
ncbi:hypothetical protein [Acidianus manzaensis]|uniref:Uncharacterized protein n=1 Tax=Acidianus manzaensis TaxID=282676 RepID=A0A1W6K2Q6_9CREN|nr:hypothetical protein [Acidianus manzaensis]ARM76823.1 hypothetical protein B6F84_12870 [Acidianus manzaensis]